MPSFIKVYGEKHGFVVSSSSSVYSSTPEALFAWYFAARLAIMKPYHPRHLGQISTTSSSRPLFLLSTTR